MEADPKISFENTVVAFRYKSNSALQKANFIFSLVNHPWISSLATSFVKMAFRMRLPIDGVIRSTAFEHFCGGESIEDSQKVVGQLAHYNVHTILDYAVEGAKSETGFDSTVSEILRVIDKSRTSSHIPFCVFKVTGLASLELLAKVQQKQALSADEKTAFHKVQQRIRTICEAGFRAGVPVLIDAEESWIQDPIDNIAYEMMSLFNREKTIVYNTFQMYREDTSRNLREAFQLAAMKSYFLGAKLVRGAYMEKERDRAEEMGYPSPIHPDKASTDTAFNDAVLFCLENKERISLMCGSHNEHSNHLLTVMMAKHGMKNDDPRVWFAQLYGMSDNISFNLAEAGYLVAKYVPYGPVRSVMPYLLHRADENTSVAGQSSRELTMIRKEIRRRKKEGAV